MVLLLNGIALSDGIYWVNWIELSVEKWDSVRLLTILSIPDLLMLLTYEALNQMIGWDG